MILFTKEAIMICLVMTYCMWFVVVSLLSCDIMFTVTKLDNITI